MSKLSFTLGVLVLHFTFHSIQAQPGETKTGTATVSGRVTLKGEPARGVTVILQGQNNIGGPRAKCDESGRFHFTGVAAGRYSVSALAPGYVSPRDLQMVFRGGQTLNLAEGEKVENIDLEIKRGGVIAGRVTDSQNRPVIEEFITLSKLDRNNKPQNSFHHGSSYEMQWTDDRGFYRIYGLPEGRYRLSVGVAPGSAGITSSREFYPRVFYPNAISESEAKVIEVSEGSEATDIDITVPDPKQTHDVYGRVVDVSVGQPVAGLEVVVGGFTRARSGKNGEFQLFGVVPGKYEIFAGAPDDPRSGEYVSDPVILDISEGDATGVEIKVRQGASISGVVIIEGTNDPKVLAKLSQVNVMAFESPTSPAPPAPMARRPIRVNPDGSFRIYGLQAGKAMIMMQPNPDLRGLKIGRTELNGAPAPEGIELDPGEQVTGVRVVLIYGTLTLSGSVKIIGGAFPAGQRFYVSARKVDQQMPISQSVEVDAQGKFVIDYLTPGEYEIRVYPTFNPNNERLDPQLTRPFSAFKERVVVAGGNQQPVTLVIDLSRKEKDK